ncbi:hypothetical protein C4544_03705 [candidate division WS5 bacterium]|uniref:Serine protease n=1 Tax=candidate division WS5 bacterium TaxID=2093353 RepID=A0A419DD56_9BACT|nr:MAG: hypothetical protein C4544_03705 [candidate division WS5 bacterium]
MARDKQKNDKIRTYSHLLEEVQQGHPVRKNLYESIEAHLKENTKIDTKLVAFFTSFTFPVLIEDQDADMLEEVLTNSSMDNKHLVLLLNSPGGEALAAERIVNICRTYSINGFSVIVPKMAKSAATMICLGANKIGMSKIGPIDPQILIRDEKGEPFKYQAAHEIIESYMELLISANKTKGRIEPFLQQLARYDARDIRNIKSAQDLSESIALTSLRNGMLSKYNESKIKNKIRPFLDPKYTKSHGRPIYYNIAQKCGLTVELYENNSDVWKDIWQLYVRINYVVSRNFSKLIESSEDSYAAAVHIISEM